MASQMMDRNQDATVYVGNLDERLTDALVWELFLQAGPIVNVHIPKDRVTFNHQGYGFVEFLSEEDADYAIKVMNMIKLYGKPIRVNKASADKRVLDIGANLFVGNLAPEVDEKMLYDTFSAFGVIMQTPKIMRDPDTGMSKGFGFINYGSFEAADAAIESMNGQFLCNRSVSVTFAYRKDVRGERHGSAAERMLAAQHPVLKDAKPNVFFSESADGKPETITGAAPSSMLPPSSTRPGPAKPLLDLPPGLRRGPPGPPPGPLRQDLGGNANNSMMDPSRRGPPPPPPLGALGQPNFSGYNAGPGNMLNGTMDQNRRVPPPPPSGPTGHPGPAGPLGSRGGPPMLPPGSGPPSGPPGSRGGPPGGRGGPLLGPAGAPSGGPPGSGSTSGPLMGPPGTGQPPPPPPTTASTASQQQQHQASSTSTGATANTEGGPSIHPSRQIPGLHVSQGQRPPMPPSQHPSQGAHGLMRPPDMGGQMRAPQQQPPQHGMGAPMRPPQQRPPTGPMGAQQQQWGGPPRGPPQQRPPFQQPGWRGPLPPNYPQ